MSFGQGAKDTLLSKDAESLTRRPRARALMPENKRGNMEGARANVCFEGALGKGAVNNLATVE